MQHNFEDMSIFEKYGFDVEKDVNIENCEVSISPVPCVTHLMINVRGHTITYNLNRMDGSKEWRVCDRCGDYVTLEALLSNPCSGLIPKIKKQFTYIIDGGKQEYPGHIYPKSKVLYTWEGAIHYYMDAKDHHVYRVEGGVIVENVTTSVQAAQGKDYK